MTSIEAYRFLDHLQAHPDLAVRLALLTDADEQVAAIHGEYRGYSHEDASEMAGLLLSREGATAPAPAGRSEDPRLQNVVPPAEDLARRLLTLATSAGRGSLLMRAGSPPLTCQRFSRDVLLGATHMHWEASSRDLLDHPLGEPPTRWLRRLHFMRAERGAAFYRNVLWPDGAGTARILADLALYVMQCAYGIDDCEASFEPVEW